MFKILKILFAVHEKESVILPEEAEVKPEDIIPNDFCLCCTPGIKCIKAAGVTLTEIPDSEHFIIIKP
ncbi:MULTISPECIES: hypothetical protein [unclassified Colwellia]|uniref:hypothetical protein n=1 Tax=unclassified Colwellia TaxID=196834 RepID=UPI0015F58888|nr:MULTISPECIES: hypothetical protein [unclassified Colwellia]MBA6256764.1 hypothetical protein [Colwellia sp. MB3u-28]MBA6261230.1 hypothetical protein [Colwellia sp. MB3u-41]